jgi:hypothetical protein
MGDIPTSAQIKNVGQAASHILVLNSAKNVRKKCEKSLANHITAF